MSVVATISLQPAFAVASSRPERVLITGGRGFVGSHVLEAFPDAAVVDLKDGNDIRTFEFPPCDVIFHLAARAAIPESFSDPLVTNDHNVVGTLRVLEHARRCGARVVFSSSSSVYGEPEQTPTREDSQLDPFSPYAASKLICEQYMRLYWRLGVKSCALRYYNVFGERQELANGGGDSSLALGIFLRQWRDQDPFTIVGTGEQRRDFVYVKDVVRANLMAAEWLKTAGRFEAFNVGSGVNYSINEVTGMIAKDHPGISLPPRPEPLVGLADISKIQDLLGWSAGTTLPEWIQLTKISN